MSEDGGSPRPDLNTMDADMSPPGMPLPYKDWAFLAYPQLRGGGGGVVGPQLITSDCLLTNNQETW